MSFIFGRESVTAAFCDIHSEFMATNQTFDGFGLKWPDDFDIKTPAIGSSRFQITRDFKSGACLINHDGILSPFTERKILTRRHKVKESSVKKRIGDRAPFSADNVFFLETGFNIGNIEFMTFDLRKKKQTAFDSYRVIAFSFPLFWLLNEVVDLEETKNKKGLDYDRIQELENDRILKNAKLKGWSFTERDTSPSEDQYREIIEWPLHDYCFERERTMIWLKFEFFSA